MKKDLVAVFNPLKREFEYVWFNDQNEPITLSIPARDFKYFPPYQGNFMAKHLADAVIHERGIKTNAEDDYKLVMKEILIEP